MADDVVGLHFQSVDEEIRRLQSVLLSSVEPRMPGVEIREVPIGSGGCALLVKVPQSWRPPHRITHSNINRFYLRYSRGVFEPDTEGLRQVFNGGLDQERQLETWRDERLERLQTGSQGFLVDGRGVVVVQVASLARNQTSFQIPPAPKCNLDFLPPILGGSTHRYNFDGLLFHAPSRSGNPVSAYTQLFTSWKVEMVRGGFVEEIQNQETLRSSLVVHFIWLAAERSIRGLVKFGSSGPFAVMVTISGLAGSVIQDNGFSGAIDRDTLRFPILTVGSEVSGARLQQELLPIWDGLWQAYNNENCRHVRTLTGDWKGFPPGWL